MVRAHRAVGIRRVIRRIPPVKIYYGRHCLAVRAHFLLPDGVGAFGEGSIRERVGAGLKPRVTFFQPRVFCHLLPFSIGQGRQIP